MNITGYNVLELCLKYPEIVDLLNEQEELIKRLKQIREEQTETILKQKRKIKELTAQLQIDDVCTKCKHHYLINYPESSKYYISKCKKEHEECSKEDIRFCEDFELKSDVGMTTKDCFHCYYAQSNEDGIHCYRETRTKVKGTDTCEHYKKIGDAGMMNKTKLIFENDVMEGYVHYINFKRVFSGALEVFKKYILPIECNMGIDANKDWLILTFIYDEKEENYLEILENDWDTVTTFLKNEDIQFAYPSWYSDWSIVILIDDFVEYVLKKYVLDGDAE